MTRISVSSQRAAGEPRTCEICERRLRDGHSFVRIGQALDDALLQLKTPLVLREVPWFTVQPQDLANRGLAHGLLDVCGEPTRSEGEPALDRVIALAAPLGLDAADFEGYAAQRWGPGWKVNARVRRLAWDELERHRNDAEGYADKVAATLRWTP